MKSEKSPPFFMKWQWKVVLGLLLVPILIGLIGFVVDQFSRLDFTIPTAGSDTSRESRHAYLAAREFCRNNLKSPITGTFSTGKPGSHDDNDMVASPVTDNIWSVSGYVDSQNGFGAMIRCPWFAQVKSLDKQWQLLELVIDGKEMFSGPDSAWPMTESEKQKAKQKEYELQQKAGNEKIRQLSEKANAERAAKLNEEKRKQQLARILAYQKDQAMAGYPSIQLELGKRFLNGDGVETNLSLAIHWLKSACTNGNVEASNLLSKINRP